MCSGALVLFHTDEFYQALYEDAYPVAAISNNPVQTLWLSGNESVPFCGFRCEELEKTVARLTETGYRLALCNGLLAMPRPYEAVLEEARVPGERRCGRLESFCPSEQ
jgi:DNA mismatch repair ATPase MutS